jgi:xanthine/uracil permease
MKAIIPIFNIVMGLGLAGLWLKDILGGRFKGGFFKWHDGDNLVWPRATGEMLTAVMLLMSGIGTLLQVGWAEVLTFFSLGAVFYASFDSLGWAFARKTRWAYSALMLAGLIGSVVFITLIISALV